MHTETRPVLDLLKRIETGTLVLNPPFQRRSVWTPAVKGHFIDTVLRGLPFPEIFVVIGEIDPANQSLVEHLVDGQQRISTLVEYLKGSPEIIHVDVKPYARLSKAAQTRFLGYLVTVRNLQNASDELVADIFNRINSADYSLKSTERFNARFLGEYKQFCENLAGNPFFVQHHTFPLAVWKRMGDILFCLTLVTTVLVGYFRREELVEEYLTKYNDDFPEKEAIAQRLKSAFAFIDACGFPDKKCRVWKRTDLFTLIVEYDKLSETGSTPEPTLAGPRLFEFYKQVDALYRTDPTGEDEASQDVRPDVLRYMKAATKATNDKYARVDRAAVVSELLVPVAERSATGQRRAGGRSGGKKRN